MDDDVSQQQRTIAKLKVDGWVQVESILPATDGSILMQLATKDGVSHIVVRLNGDRVDARQKLGKSAVVPNAGQP